MYLSSSCFQLSYLTSKWTASSPSHSTPGCVKQHKDNYTINIAVKKFHNKSHFKILGNLTALNAATPIKIINYVFVQLYVLQINKLWNLNIHKYVLFLNINNLFMQLLSFKQITCKNGRLCLYIFVMQEIKYYFVFCPD